MNGRLVFLWLVTCLVPTISVAADVGPCVKGAPQSEYSWNPRNELVTPRLAHFYQLGDEVQAAYVRKNDLELADRAKEFLELAAIYRCNWNYGNAIHDANRYLGLSSLRAGKVDEAADFLVLAAKSTGSPQLDTFGPDLDLANALLKRGKTQAVIEYLQGVHHFWEMDNGRTGKWIAAISKGEKPELDRVAVLQNPWWTAVDFLITALPLMLTLTLLYVGRHRLRRKVVFVVAALGLGYGAWLLIGYLMGAVWGRMVSTWASAGKLGEFALIYLPIVLAIAVPASVVFCVFRYLLTRPSRDVA
jgi:hypothetical protein